jgi:hypothetical protein
MIKFVGIVNMYDYRNDNVLKKNQESHRRYV